MNKIIVRSENTNEFFSQKKNSRRGAKVYGIPVSREIAEFVEDVAPDASRQRFISMFFGGNCSLLDEDDLDDDIDLFTGEDDI